MKTPPIKKIAAAINAAPRIIIATHIQADGDAVGSVLGLVHALRARGRNVVPWPVVHPPRRYRFLKGFDELEIAGDPAVREGDILLALDCADPGRLPHALVPWARRGERVIAIDHHASNGGFGELRWVDPQAPAASAQVWELLLAMGDPFPLDSAYALYIGIATDTGNFTFSNTNKWAFEAAADLINRGVEVARVERELQQRFTLEYANVLGAALAGMKRAVNGAVVYMSLSRADMERAGAGGDETEGIVDFTRRIAGCRVGVLFRELINNAVKVSFRAADELDLLPLAVAHGGGGHAAAAGCRVEGTLAEVQRLILAEVETWLRGR